MLQAQVLLRQGIIRAMLRVDNPDLLEAIFPLLPPVIERYAIVTGDISKRNSLVNEFTAYMLQCHDYRLKSMVQR